MAPLGCLLFLYGSGKKHVTLAGGILSAAKHARKWAAWLHTQERRSHKKEEIPGEFFRSGWGLEGLRPARLCARTAHTRLGRVRGLDEVRQAELDPLVDVGEVDAADVVVGGVDRRVDLVKVRLCRAKWARKAQTNA